MIRQPDCVFSSINQIPALHRRAKALGWLCLGLTSGRGHLPPLFLLCERAEIVDDIMAASFAIQPFLEDGAQSGLVKAQTKSVFLRKCRNLCPSIFFV
jgi:hypothetical protein